MSLSAYSNGILETHVTWEEVENDMQKKFNTDAGFGPNKTAKNIGEGIGFMSRMCLIEPDWQNRSEDLPIKFIAKICSQLTTVEYSKKSSTPIDPTVLEHLEKVARRAHNVEVSAYEIMDKYDKERRIIRSKIFASRKFSDENPTKGYILMEYFEKLEPIHLIDNLGPNEMRQALKSLAAFHALGIKLTEEEKSLLFSNVLTTLWAKTFNLEVVKGFFTRFRTFVGDDFEPKVQKLEEIAPFVFSPEHYKAMEEFTNKIGMDPVLAHGDLWSTNVLWSKDGNNNSHTLQAVIDFQVVNHGNPGVDIARLFASNLSGKDRRDHAEELLEEYYGYAKNEFDGYKMPFTLEQLKRSYKYYFVFCGYIVAPHILPVFDGIIKKRNQEDLKEEIMKQVLEKTEALFEDMAVTFEGTKHEY